MGDANSRMAEDLGKHALEDLQRVLNRHMSIAMSVLPPPDFAMMLINMANGIAMGTALYMLQTSKNESDPEAVLEMARFSLARMFELAKPEVLRRFEALGRAEAA